MVRGGKRKEGEEDNEEEGKDGKEGKEDEEREAKIRQGGVKEDAQGKDTHTGGKGDKADRG